jgi:hypothetical protein
VRNLPPGAPEKKEKGRKAEVVPKAGLLHYLMMGMVPSHRAAREQYERDALRLLCSDLIQPETREQLAQLLTEYVFADGLNHAVYEAVVGIGAVSARRLKELLPGRLTNLGFPDFELKDFLGRSGGTEDDIDKLFESLLELTEVQPEKGGRALGQSA